MIKHNTKNFTIHLSHGFTIVELMVAIAISAIAMAAVYSTFIVQQRSFVFQDQIAETQASSKIASNIAINDLRMAGHGYPIDESPSINGFKDNITVSDSGTNGGPDAITLVGGFRQVATLLSPTTVGDTQISIAYFLGAPSLNLSNRNDISIDGINFATISNCTLQVSDCKDAAGNPLTLDRGVGKSFPAGRPVYLIEDVTYRIATAPGSSCNSAPAGSTCLEKVKWLYNSPDTAAIVNNIDDLQFAYAVDTNSDSRIDDQNANNRLDPGDYLSPPLPPNSRVLAIRSNLLASTANDDPTLDPSTKPYYASGIILENNTTADTDRLRRRIWSMETALRNAR
jgi:prepilin-type N-terminal cleavage/methylation domain-containing protein